MRPSEQRADPTVTPGARRGWDSTFPEFGTAPRSEVLSQLRRAYPESSPQEVDSWRRNVPELQREVSEVVRIQTDAADFTAVMEYELPMESRRADVVLLVGAAVVVLELKGKVAPSDADIDQAHAYSRDLSCYHRDCHSRPVHAVLVPTRMPGPVRTERGVTICPPDLLDGLIADLSDAATPDPLVASRFLDSDAYRPMPSLVRAARELFRHKRPPQLWRAAANTDAAVECVQTIVRQAYQKGTRHLVLVRGAPGSGKTLVGLRLAHSPRPGEYAAEGDGPQAIFLSGNGPLVEVLQYVLKPGGGGGKTFVRPIRDYVKRFSRNSKVVPGERLVVFDEAQRAHDRARVADVHKTPPQVARSEPEHFIEFAERQPDWSVVVGLIGDGQEIHLGEESGLALWATALRQSPQTKSWRVHGPQAMAGQFEGLDFSAQPELSLDETIRSHFASRLHEYVARIVAGPEQSGTGMRALAARLEREGHDLRITRDLEKAKRYLRERYADDPEARYGLIASSRDRDLAGFGIPNDWQSTRRVRYGPWYNDREDDPAGQSCRHLEEAVTEFGAQGLELDAVLLAWGTDFRIVNGSWSIDRARKYRPSGHSTVKDPAALRANAYRVLLTRGRDAHVVFMPPLEELDETMRFLLDSGFRRLR
ncbi:MAG: DUF2075 domain-containing protein [Chloroflexi bacterium]|nr:DUF2075 domain-containing protein [Chloroflexota bacterium]